MQNIPLKINYIELAVHNIEETKSFYSEAFGWTYQDYGSEYCEFFDGNMTGGFHSHNPVQLGGPLIVLYSDDLERSQSRVTDAGGKIVKEIFSFPGGKRFHFTDVNGYELAVWKKD